ncbi:unnamed protein product, partial [Brassica oleracea var. botrytis]
MVAALPREKRKPALRRKETQSVKRNKEFTLTLGCQNAPPQRSPKNF